MIYFWRFMCWLDDMLHWLDFFDWWNWLTDTNARYRFCNWAQWGYADAIDAKGETE